MQEQERANAKAVNTAEGARGDQGEVRDMLGAMGMGVHMGKTKFY